MLSKLLSSGLVRLAGALLLSLCFARGAFAHPMGNFSVNHYSKISLGSDGVTVRYIIDLAEIPAYQEMQQGNVPANAADTEVTRFVGARGAQLGGGLRLVFNGKPVELRLRSSQVIFPPGAGGLPTMKMGFLYEAAYPADVNRSNVSFYYTDGNYTGHAGWKEIIAVPGAGTLLHSSVPSTDRSGELTNYPTDLLSSPPQDLEASFQALLPPLAATASVTSHPYLGTRAATESGAKPTPGPRMAATATLPTGRTADPPQPVASRAGPGASHLPVTSSSHRSVTQSQAAPVSSLGLELKANQQLTPRSKFTELITAQHLSPWFLFTAAFIAMGLGALHALEPGHGKTIVGAYLVGSRGTARHAALLGVIVTVSHTAGVFALGAITLYASRYFVPEQLYPWLGLMSGITIAALGCYMLLRRLTGTATDHSHAPGEGHMDGFFKKKPAVEQLQTAEAAVDSQELQARKPIGLGQLFTLGITGGIIPCPAALIVLLSAFALHRVGLGLFLIVAFSMGLAAVLIGFGMLMVSARRFMSHLVVDGPLTKKWLPAASSSFITILGLVLTWQAFAAMHIHLQFTRASLGPVLFVSGLGLILGMRHSTDADHVVAISTIVSKQRSIRGAAFIGSVWGLGHTITIFIVGALIILFNVKIPPRIGLSMEFCVAIMLVLLGILNLTGVMQRFTSRWTRKPVDALLEPTGPSTSSGLRGRLRAGTVGRFGVYQFLRPLVIGLVHGLAGSAAVALLVLSTIHSPAWATIYLLIFGVGTMIGMMMMTAAMAVPLSYAGDRFLKVSRFMGVASGMVSLCFGSFLVYQLGFLGGLFTSHPEWTPR